MVKRKKKFRNPFKIWQSYLLALVLAFLPIIPTSDGNFITGIGYLSTTGNTTAILTGITAIFTGFLIGASFKERKFLIWGIVLGLVALALIYAF